MFFFEKKNQKIMLNLMALKRRETVPAPFPSEEPAGSNWRLAEKTKRLSWFFLSAARRNMIFLLLFFKKAVLPLPS
jgi:hypothetical protein